MATTGLIERIAYEVDGDGDAVLLIHGLGGTSNTFTAIAPAFARLRRIAFDLPGSGRSHRVEGPLSIERFVQAALRVLSAAGAQRAHVVGHSLGTIVAAHLAAAEPRAVRSLALFGPLLAPPEPARANIRARGAKARSEGVAGMQQIADALVQGSTSARTKSQRGAAVAFVRESLMRQDPDGYARTCDALAQAQPADASKIECPTLLVTGDEDGVAPPQSVRMMGERIAGARIEVLRGCGHWTPIEMPDECIALLNAFYAQRAAQR
ncbi:MAG TPA: alpha/beta fold hydrolase [Burkholderiaceae bacterium]|nr:alpha/beta fold hydrolase [Burkholderiaceae bacterium]